MSLLYSIPGPSLRPEKVADRMEQVSLNSIRRVLPDSAILEACAAIGYVFRKRTITPILTVLHMILAAIWPEDSFNASWQVLWDGFASHAPGSAGTSPSTGSLAKARERLPIGLFDRLWMILRPTVERASEPFARWRGLRVILVDGTCLSMPDRPKLWERFGVYTGFRGQAKYPLARVVTLALAGSMTVLDYALGRYDQAEVPLLRSLLPRLGTGDLLIGDRNFAGANLYAEYDRQGLAFITQAHAHLRVTQLKPITRHGPQDFTAYLKINKTYREMDPTLPDQILVRFIQITVRSRGRSRAIWLVTNLLDPERYPAVEIAAVHARRWRIETLLGQVKVRLKADVLRSTNPDGIEKEIAARLMAVNLIRLIILEAASEHRVDPLRISFVHALRAVLTFAPAMAFEPTQKLPAIYREMLRQIALHQVPDRPGRNEPRALRREIRYYPPLTVTRKQWRQAMA